MTLELAELRRVALNARPKPGRGFALDSQASSLFRLEFDRETCIELLDRIAELEQENERHARLMAEQTLRVAEQCEAWKQAATALEESLDDLEPGWRKEPELWAALLLAQLDEARALDPAEPEGEP